MLATDMGSSQLKMLAQKVREIKPWQNLRTDALAVDIDGDRQGIDQPAPLELRSGRQSKADTQRSINTPAKCRRIEADAC